MYSIYARSSSFGLEIQIFHKKPRQEQETHLMLDLK